MTVNCFRSVLFQLKELYDDFYWPYDKEETVLGVRYCVAGLLVTAALLIVVATFVGQKHL